MTINDNDRREWVMNDEGLYLWFCHSVDYRGKGLYRFCQRTSKGNRRNY